MNIPGNIALFEGINPDDLAGLLSCLAYRITLFTKGSFIIREGEPVESIGIILDGMVQISRMDFDGNRMILASFGSLSVFAESFVCAGIRQSPVSVQATEDSSILFLPFKKLIRTCESACVFHVTLMENMMKLLAQKNILLNTRIEITGKRTICEKVLSYLEFESHQNRSKSFTISYSRNELADFLSVNRSALSRELGHMQKVGLISVSAYRFTIR
jgi:CRP-like cAMP-binding protein